MARISLNSSLPNRAVAGDDGHIMHGFIVTSSAAAREHSEACGMTQPRSARVGVITQ